MRPRASLSGLGLVATCPGSASLPHARTRSAPADFGNAAHALIAGRIDGGEPDADALAAEHGLSEDDAGRLAYLAKHMRLDVPAGALAEVPLGYWPDGSARRVVGGQGRYEDAGQLLSGTLDCMWAEPAPLITCGDDGCTVCIPACREGSTLYVVDWKTGDEENVEPVGRNWQLRAGAMMAAKWTGAKRVVPAIVYVNPAECSEWLREHPGEPYPGRWEVGAELNEAALAGIEADVRRVLKGAGIGEGDAQDDEVRDLRSGSGSRQARDSVPDARRGEEASEGAGVAFVTGAHCAHCNAAGACSALARQALTLAGVDDGALTAETAARFAAMLGPARAVLGRVEDAVRGYVRMHGPIALPGGKVYGPASEDVERLDAAAVFGALEAAGATDPKVRPWEALRATKDGIRDAVKGARRGTFGRVLEAVRA
ncbi:MAG TPA: hypothetical protein PKZ08_13925, partial [Vicinamibacterales bacterium]|nr:hypothetical protein [Vicinamibacterales bacterium]